MQKNSDNFSMQEAMRLAKSDAGQQLIALLQTQNSEALQKAADQAAAGDYEQVKKTMAALLSSPEAKTLMEQLRRNSNG